MTVHACVPRAITIIQRRAVAVGHTPGFNHVDGSGILVGTDLEPQEVARTALEVAEQLVQDLAALDDPDLVAPCLAQFWTHGLAVGAVAVKECVVE